MDHPQFSRENMVYLGDDFQKETLRGIKKVLDEQRSSVPGGGRTLEAFATQLLLGLDRALGNQLVLSLHDDALRRPSERLEGARLAGDASNLPAVLARLSGPTLGRVRAALSALIPGLAGFEVVGDDDELHIEFISSTGERLPARLASSGTLRILALMTAISISDDSEFIGIEEPEDGIYPRRLRDLLEILRESTEPTPTRTLPAQLVLTTHSPVAIAALQSHSESIRFIDTVRRNGERVTRTRRVGEPAPDDRGRMTISTREIGELLDLGRSEDEQ